MSDETVLLPVPLKKDDHKAFKDAVQNDGENMSKLVRSWIAEYMRSKQLPFSSDTLEHGGSRRTHSSKGRGGNRRKLA